MKKPIEYQIDLPSTISEQNLVKLAHIAGSIQRDKITRESQDYLKEIFYATMGIRYCDLPSRELTLLRTRLIRFAGVESGLIHPNKGVTI